MKHLFILFLLLGFGRCTPALSQGSPHQVGRFLLGPSKFDTSYWAEKTFVSIEPTTSHVTACVTICPQEPGEESPYSREGWRYTLYLSAPEFAAIERLFRYSLAKAESQFPGIDTVKCFAYEVYFHKDPLYSARWLGEKSRLTAFFSSLLEEVACAEDVSAATQANLLPLLKNQLDYLSIEEQWRKPQARKRKSRARN